MVAGLRLAGNRVAARKNKEINMISAVGMSKGENLRWKISVLAWQPVNTHRLLAQNPRCTHYYDIIRESEMTHLLLAYDSPITRSFTYLLTILITPLIILALLTVPVMYSAMSINEYITHRYYQHAGFNNNWLMQTIFKGLKTDGGGIAFFRSSTYSLTHSLTHHRPY